MTSRCAGRLGPERRAAAGVDGLDDGDVHAGRSTAGPGLDLTTGPRPRLRGELPEAPRHDQRGLPGIGAATAGRGGRGERARSGRRRRPPDRRRAARGGAGARAGRAGRGRSRSVAAEAQHHGRVPEPRDAEPVMGARPSPRPAMGGTCADATLTGGTPGSRVAGPPAAASLSRHGATRTSAPPTPSASRSPTRYAAPPATDAWPRTAARGAPHGRLGRAHARRARAADRRPPGAAGRTRPRRDGRSARRRARRLDGRGPRAPRRVAGPQPHGARHLAGHRRAGLLAVWVLLFTTVALVRSVVEVAPRHRHGRRHHGHGLLDPGRRYRRSRPRHRP